jgi:glutamate racemase
MLGVSDPALVRGIEAGDAAAAFTASQLPATLRTAQRLGLDAVFLACTHFTALVPLITAWCDLPVIDVGTRLVELTKAAVTESANHG